MASTGQSPEFVDHARAVTHVTTGYAEAESRAEPHKARLLFRALLVTALLALSLAVVVNWLAVPWDWGSGQLRVSVPAPDGRVPPPGIKTAVNELPGAIPGFENITRQAVPGQGGRAVEALYVTLNMNLEIQVPIAVYVRAEGFPSGALARRRATEIAGPFPVGASSVRVGKTAVGRAGYSSDRGAYTITWTRGQHVFFVKSTFRDKAPAQKRDFLRVQARPVADAIEAYQRSGKRSIKL